MTIWDFPLPLFLTTLQIISFRHPHYQNMATQPKNRSIYSIYHLIRPAARACGGTIGMARIALMKVCWDVMSQNKSL